MMTETESAQGIQLTGKSGHHYKATLYTDKTNEINKTGKHIACLSNSTYEDGNWTHHINSIYNIENPKEEFARFQQRDDISHLILVPYAEIRNNVPDPVDDLIRAYIHS